MRSHGESGGGRKVYQALAHSHRGQAEVAQAVELAKSLERVDSIGDALADYLSRFSHPGNPHRGLEL